MSEQDNRALVVAFKMMLPDAWSDTVRDLEADPTQQTRVSHVCGYRISDERLGQMLRAVKAMDA